MYSRCNRFGCKPYYPYGRPFIRPYYPYQRPYRPYPYAGYGYGCGLGGCRPRYYY